VMFYLSSCLEKWYKCSKVNHRVTKEVPILRCSSEI